MEGLVYNFALQFFTDNLFITRYPNLIFARRRTPLK